MHNVGGLGPGKGTYSACRLTDPWGLTSIPAVRRVFLFVSARCGFRLDILVLIVFPGVIHEMFTLNKISKNGVHTTMVRPSTLNSWFPG